MKYLLLVAFISFTFQAVGQTLQNITDNGSATTNTISINTGHEGLSLLGNSYLSFKNASGLSRTGYIQHDGSNLVVGLDIGNVSFNSNVGIGVSNPSFRLDVAGEARLVTTIVSNSNFPFTNSSVLFSEVGVNNMFGVDGGFNTKYFGLKTNGDFVTMGGNVGIGTSDPQGYKLAVNGNIRAREIKVENSNWPDYVFEKSYTLPTLKEIEVHIKEKGHLPGIPSAAEVKANGIDLGEMNAMLLQKIEELTLHLIEQAKSIKELQNKNHRLEIKQIKKK